MSFLMQWYAENQVLYVEWPEVVTVEVVADYVQRTSAYLASSPAQQVHTFSNATHMKDLPPLLESRNLVSVLHMPKMGWSVTYGSHNPVLKMIVQMVTNVVPIRVRFVKDLDEGIKFLSEVDSTLPDLNQFRNSLSD